jgi:hypothetical protein
VTATGTHGRGGGLKVILGAVAVVGALLVIGVLSIDHSSNERYDPAATGPEGTKALVELLERFGAHVEVAQSFPVRADVAIAFPDSVPDSRVDDVRRWAADGSTLVVADAASELTPLAEPAAVATSGTLPQGACDIDGLTDLGPLNLGPRSSSLRFRRQPGMPMCWSDGSHAYAALLSEGQGRILSLADGTPFQNQSLDEDDNAALATAVLAPRPGTRVAILTRAAFPGQPTGPTSASDAFGRLMATYPAIGLVLAQLGIALVLFALARGHRLGRPVGEPQPVQIAGSSLTEAVGRLLRQRQDPDAVARVLRAEGRRTVAARSGLPAAAPPAVLAEALEARTGRPPHESLAVLDGPPIASDAELVALAEQIDTVVEEVTHGRSP